MGPNAKTQKFARRTTMIHMVPHSVIHFKKDIESINDFSGCENKCVINFYNGRLLTQIQIKISFSKIGSPILERYWLVFFGYK